MIYLHGWGFTSAVFDLLDVNGEDERPCLYSLADDIGYTAIADAIADRCKDDTVLVGWSMGGQIAIQASLRTNRIKGLVLIASTPLLVNRTGWDVGIDEKAYSNLCRAFKQDPEEALQEVVTLSAYGDKDYMDSAKRLSAYVAGSENTEALTLLLEQLGQVDLRAELKALSIPVLMCAGMNDALVSVRLFDVLAHEHIQTRLYPDTGHAPFVSHASDMMSHISDFQSRLL